MYADELTLGTNDTFDNNSFANGGNGAGVENQYNLNLTNSHIDNNTCSGGNIDGCGLYEAGDGASYTNVTVNGSNANAGTGTVDGGAIYSSPDQARFNGLTVNGTSATGATVDGGAIYAQYLTIDNATVSSTTAHGSATTGGSVNGGAIYNEEDSSFTNVAISGDHCQRRPGDGVHAVDDTVLGRRRGVLRRRDSEYSVHEHHEHDDDRIGR